MAIIRLEDVPQEVSELLGDAAKRIGMLKRAYIVKRLTEIVNDEYARQQMDGE